MIKMAQLEDIRKMYFMEGLSIREINRRTGIHRDTISKYISLEEPKPPKYKKNASGIRAVHTNDQTDNRR